MSNAETADTPQAHCGRAETSDVLRTLEQLKIVPSYNPEDIRNQHFKRFKGMFDIRNHLFKRSLACSVTKNSSGE